MQFIAAVPRLIFATVATLTLGLSQAPPAPPPPLLRFDVNLVQVDATVTDGHGRHIPDLTAADFEVSQAGKDRRITHFEYVPAATKDGRARLAAASPSQLSRDEVRRTFLFYIDDIHLSFSDFALTRAALLRFIDEDMRDNDVCALVRSTGVSTISFTSDRRRLRYLVERQLWEPTPDDRKHPDELYNKLGISIYYMATLPGRKSLVLIHTGAASPPDVTSLRGLADVANRAGVTINVVDSRGVSVTGALPNNWSEASERGSTRPFDMLATNELPRPLQYIYSMLGLNLLSEMTGGPALHDQNDLHEAVGAVADDAEGYYLLGWDPGPEVFTRPKSGSYYVPITVRVHRHGTFVRTRSGFFGSRGDISPPPPVTTAQQMNDAVFSPLRMRDIDVRLTSSFEGDYVESMVHIGPAGLRLTPKGQDCVTAETELLSSLRPLDVNSRDRMKLESHRSTFEVCGATRDVVAQQGFVSVIRTPVARPGPYELAVVVRNVVPGEPRRPSLITQPRVLGDCPGQPRPAGRRTLITRGPDTPPPDEPALIERFLARTETIGSALSFIEVPDLRKPTPALSGIRLAKEKPPADEAAGDFFFRPPANPDPAIRAFRPGDTITFRARRWGSCESCAGTLSVYLDNKLLAEQPVHLPVGATTGAWRLQADAAPGRYMLRLSLAGDKPRDRRPATQQWIDFSVER